jgi:hypothetical protein
VSREHCQAEILIKTKIAGFRDVTEIHASTLNFKICRLTGFNWWMHLRGDQLPRWRRFAGFTLERPVRAIGRQPAVLHSYRTILNIIRRQALHGALDAAVVLPQLFVALHKTIAPAPSPDTTQALLDAVQGAPMDLAAMAQQAGMTRFAFLRAFRRRQV